MYRFQHIEYLWLLALVPLAVLIYLAYYRWRRKSIGKLGDTALVQQQLYGNISGRKTTKFFLATMAITCCIIGLANFQKGAQTDTAERKGVDVLFALDVSKSMLAKDIQPDRLTRAQQLIELMIDKMKNDRVGLVIFAGRAYLQIPLTIDYNSAKMLLSTVSTNNVPTQGTVLAEAIDMSRSAFSQKEKKFKTLILISDGEDHDENAVKAAKAAAEEGVVIHTIGIGSPKGAPIVDPATGKQKTGDQGNVVISKLNEDILQDIARAGGGSYQLFNNAGIVAGNLTDAIATMESRSMGTLVYSEYESYFQYFLAAALLFSVIGYWIPTSGKISASTPLFSQHNEK